ncbi:hypothetical protein JCM16303_002248 [Sporobolomyces ruberrimus]
MSTFLRTRGTHYPTEAPDFSAFLIEGGADDRPDPDRPTNDTADAHSRVRVESDDARRALTLPGGYDFEPQAYEGGSGGAQTSTTPGFAPRANSRSRLAASSASHGPTSTESDEYPAVDESTRTVPLWGRLRARLGGNRVGLSAYADEDDARGAERGRLLFDQDVSDETDSEHRAGESSYPPRNIHLPLPARPPTFAPPSVPLERPLSGGTSTNPTLAPAGRVYGGGAANDGVFSNLAAKPEGSSNTEVVGEGPDKDEILPAYEAAALDSTPPYWETTVIAPGSFLGPDDICVDGMPVGNLFSFAWNLLVSMSFQFVGFLLTYLLHTTHAAKNGSRAGFGITLIQLGFYLKQHTDHSGDPLFQDGSAQDETGLNGSPGPQVENVRWSWWGGEIEEIAPPAPASSLAAAVGNLPTQISGSLAGAFDASEARVNNTNLPSLMGSGSTEAELNSMTIATNEWMSFALVTVGSFLLIGGCLSYWRAVRYARAMRQGQGPGADHESTLAIS